MRSGGVGLDAGQGMVKGSIYMKSPSELSLVLNSTQHVFEGLADYWCRVLRSYLTNSRNEPRVLNSAQKLDAKE